MLNLLILSDVSSDISNVVEQGLEVILNFYQAYKSIIIQLCATLILFLIVRIFLWKKITAVIEKKEQNEREAFQKLDDAKKEASEVKKQIALDLEANRKEGAEIIERAKQKSYREAEEIIKKANIDANMKLEDAKEQIAKEVANANEEIKKEIVETAYLLAEEIIKREIDKSKYDELVNEFIKREAN